MEKDDGTDSERDDFVTLLGSTDGGIFQSIHRRPNPFDSKPRVVVVEKNNHETTILFFSTKKEEDAGKGNFDDSVLLAASWIKNVSTKRHSEIIIGVPKKTRHFLRKKKSRGRQRRRCSDLKTHHGWRGRRRRRHNAAKRRGRRDDARRGRRRERRRKQRDDGRDEVTEGPLDMQNAIEAIAARKAAAKTLLETVERDKRFQSICKKTSNKALQKVYKRVTKYETQAHNKEWILSKMAKFILEEMLVLPREKNGEVEEVFARLMRLVKETVLSEAEMEARSVAALPTTSASNNDINRMRCTRNDGKSWRCSCLAEPGHKHCAKHLKWGYGARLNHQQRRSLRTETTTYQNTRANNNRRKSNMLSKRKVATCQNDSANLSEISEKQERLREEKLYEQQRIEYKIRMRKKIKSSFQTIRKSAHVVCTIERCVENGENEDEDGVKREPRAFLSFLQGET